MDEIRELWATATEELKKTFYRSPLGNRRRKPRKQRDGKVHIYSMDEIRNYVQSLNKVNIA